MFYTYNCGLGLINGMMITGLTLTFSPGYVIGGGIIGMMHGAMFTYAFRTIVIRSYLSMSEQSKYVDSDFVL